MPNFPFAKIPKNKESRLNSFRATEALAQVFYHIHGLVA
jgi:hypothetical protein